MSEPTVPPRDEVQRLLHEAQQLLKSTLRDNALGVVVIAAAAGFVAGVLLARRR